MTNLQADPDSDFVRKLIRFAAATAAICGCLIAAYIAANAGLSKYNSEGALVSGSLAEAERSVKLTPSDADAHFARAIALSYNGRPDEAIKEYEEAARFRPRDYFLWQTLGTARDQAGDDKGALAVFDEAVRLAPYYAQPRWQRGNVLLRTGRRDEAFVELRRAAASDSSFLPSLLDLAWGIFGGDAGAVERVIQPQTPQWHLQLARFFIKHGKMTEGVAQLRAAGTVSEEERNTLLQDLLAARRFRDAYEIWSGKSTGAAAPASESSITDGGFENLKSLDQPGFGWQRRRDVQVVITLDTTEPRNGTQSLRLEYKGDSNPNAPALSQLVLVEPNSHYRLRFAARTQDVVTGGLPLIVITDAGNNLKITQSNPLPRNTSGWQDFTVEFDTGKETEAVLIGIQRQPCPDQPCPIFGKLWLDDFLLQKA